MIQNMSNVTPIDKHIEDGNEVWFCINELCDSHKFIMKLFDTLQDRIVYLEKKLGHNAVCPESIN